jgi:hypothetical protein
LGKKIKEKNMPLDEFIISVFCCVEDLLKKICHGLKIRQRGFSPKLSDAELMTIEIVGEFLGFKTDKKIWEYFKRHFNDWFPQLPCRTTFVRQAANLWKIKQSLQKQLSQDLGSYGDDLYIIDGFPIPVCHFARARRGHLFKGEAGFGRCVSKRQVYFGFKGHLLVTSEGMIASFLLTPANVEEHGMAEELLQGFKGLVIGDKGFISQSLKKTLQAKGIHLQTPLKKNMKDERDPKFLRKIKGIRRLVETVIGQLNDRFHISRIWARDTWHLVARLSRKLLAHTLGIFLNKKLDRSPIRFDGLLTI